jgi:hypothetical protein
MTMATEPANPSCHSLERGEEEVRGDADHTRANDLLISIHFFFILFLLAKVRNISEL